MERQLETNASSLDEIIRVLRRLPFTPDEGMYASEIIAKCNAKVVMSLKLHFRVSIKPSIRRAAAL